MSEMVATAYSLGLEQIAITDHYDEDYANKLYGDSGPDYVLYHNQVDAQRENFAGKIKVVRGLEVGIQKHITDKCSQTVMAYPYDFIIGSFHCAEKRELYGGDFLRGRSLKNSFVSFYEEVYACLSIYKDYSVVGHFNLLERYADKAPDHSWYWDIIEATFKMIIADGKGLEFNTSSFRYDMGDTLTPCVEMLKLYKELGGEIITVGSDAHRPEHLANHFALAEEVLKGVGFRYLTTFESLAPRMEKF